MFTEAQIRQVMQQTGTDYLQALRHLQQRQALQRLPVQFPLGKSAYDA